MTWSDLIFEGLSIRFDPAPSCLGRPKPLGGEVLQRQAHVANGEKLFYQLDRRSCGWVFREGAGNKAHENDGQRLVVAVGVAAGAVVRLNAAANPRLVASSSGYWRR